MALYLSSDRTSKAERRRAIIDDMYRLPGYIKEILSMDESLRQLAVDDLSKEKSVLVMGRGYQNATCLEGALKIKEVSYMHSEGILAGELKHGPLALIDENMVRIFEVILARYFSYDQRFFISKSTIGT